MERARERAREWHAANRERANAASRAYRDANRDALLEKQRAYYAANKDAHAERQRQWAAANPEKMRAYCATYRASLAGKPEEWRAARRARKLVLQQNRRSRELAVGRLSADIASLLMALQRSRCANCTTDLRKSGHHLDHIEPLARGGANVDSNVQLLCPPCNLRKSARDPIAWANQQGRLL